MRPGTKPGEIILEHASGEQYPAGIGVGDPEVARMALVGIFAATVVRLDLPPELDPDTERRCLALSDRLNQARREGSDVALDREEVATLREATAAALAAYPSALTGIEEFTKVVYAAFMNAGFMRAAASFENASPEAAAELALTALGPTTIPSFLADIPIVGSRPVIDTNTGRSRLLTLGEAMPSYLSAAGVVVCDPSVRELGRRLDTTAP